MKHNNAKALAGYAKDRINNKNANVQQAFIGQTGSGKTYSSANFSHLVDDSFYDDTEKIVFSAKDFMHQIQRMRSGEALLFEEAGVAIAARNFQSKINKMVGMVNQTFRHRNLCVTYTVPSMRFFEMQVRDLLHCIIQMQRIDYENDVAYGRCYKVNHNPLYGTTNLTTYEFETWSGGRHVIDIVGFNKPPKKWLTEYEKMKSDFTDDLYSQFEKELSEEENKQNPKTIKLHANQANVLMNMLPELRKHHKWSEIEDWSKVSARTMQRWLENETLTSTSEISG